LLVRELVIIFHSCPEIINAVVLDFRGFSEFLMHGTVRELFKFLISEELDTVVPDGAVSGKGRFGKREDRAWDMFVEDLNGGASVSARAKGGGIDGKGFKLADGGGGEGRFRGRVDIKETAGLGGGVVGFLEFALYAAICAAWGGGHQAVESVISPPLTSKPELSKIPGRNQQYQSISLHVSRCLLHCSWNVVDVLS
jgi:hypothetical protein